MHAKRYDAFMVRWVVLMITLYIAADVAIPQMPGAVVFDAAGSVELRQSGRFWASDDVMPPSHMRARPILIAGAERSAHPVLVAWRRAVRLIRPRRLFPPQHFPLDDEVLPPGHAAAV